MAQERPPVDRGRLEKAARMLRPIEREVLVLAAAEGLNNQEIAERLGITPKAVERVLARALVALDRALERQERPWWWFW